MPISSSATKQFSERNVLVTGGSSGIGRAVALAFAERGANVVITYNTNSEGSDDTLDCLHRVGGNHSSIQIDFSDATEENMSALIEEAAEFLGGIDILINNAGDMCRKSFLDVTDSDYTRVLATNMKAPWFLTKAFAQKAITDNITNATVVNVSSISDRLALDTLSLYQMSKAALSMQTQSAALSLAKHNIRVNAVCPGLVATNLNKTLRATDPEQWAKRSDKIPLGAGKPEYVAHMILFLASNDARWITGKAYTVDGGQIGSLYDSQTARFFRKQTEDEPDAVMSVKAKL